jgi:hypothetical protein
MYCCLRFIYTRCDWFNEWKTEKRHECANMGKVKRLEIWWQLYVTWIPVRDLENFRPMDFCSTECTPNFVWNRKCPLRQIRPSLDINQLSLRYVINAEKAFTLNCSYSRLTALNVNIQHDNGETQGRENFKLNFSTSEDKKVVPKTYLYTPAQWLRQCQVHVTEVAQK